MIFKNTGVDLKDSGYFAGLLGTFLLCPVLSLYFIVDGMLKGRRSAYFVFAFFMGLLAFMLAPVSDLGSYAFMYYRFDSQTLGQVFENAFRQHDFVMKCLLGIFSHLHIPFGFFTFLNAFVAFCLLNIIFLYKIDNSDVCYSPKEVVVRYFCYVAVFPFILLVGGVRFGYGAVIMFYGFHLYIDRNMKVSGLIIVLCASFIHYSLLYFALGSIAMLFVRIDRKMAITLLVVLAVCSLPLQTYVQKYFESNELTGAGYLGDGTWGRQVGQTLRITALGYHWGQRVFLLPLVFLFFKQYDKYRLWGRVFLSFLFMFSIAYTAFTLAQRLTVLVQTISIFIYLEEEAKGYVPKIRQGFILIMACILIGSFDLYTHRTQILLSNYWRLFQPVPVTLLEGYDYSWLFMNVRDRFS